MECFGRFDFSHADHHHLGEAALHGPGEAGVEFDAIENEDAVRFGAVAVHPHFTGRDFANLDDIHAGSDLHPGGCFGEPEALDHGPLSLGRGPIVGTHARSEEGSGAVFSEPVAGRARDGEDVIDSSASCGDRNLTLGRFYLEGIELAVNFSLNVG